MSRPDGFRFQTGNNDERYTPMYGVTPIVPYIPKTAVIWCPFDTESSNYVKAFRARGNKVIASHKDTGQDFFHWEPKEDWDLIVSNPPFTGKRQIFERCLSFRKPFALLMTLVWLNDRAPALLFMYREFELMLLDERIEFINAPTDKDVTFACAYYCHKVLPKGIVVRKIQKPR